MNLIPEPCNQIRLLRAAAYIRVSTGKDTQEDSYQTQLAYFERLLAQHPGWTSVGIYSDYGISGTGMQKRTGFNRLMRHCKDGRIDHIITKSISRFSRNTREFLNTLDILEKNHITIAFEKENIDTSAAQNHMLLTAFGAVAQEESRSISANIRWGIDKRGRQGDVRNICIYGYCYPAENAWETTKTGYHFRTITICENEAAIVRRIFKETAEGKSYVEIARGLNRDNIPPPQSAITRKRAEMKETPPGQLNAGLTEGWNGKHISQIVRLERYAGDVMTAKTFIEDYKTHRAVRNTGQRQQFYIKDHHPAIIERDLFEQVQTILQMNRSRKQNCGGMGPRYPFSGRLVCKHCGRFYRTRNRASNPLWLCASTISPAGKPVCFAAPVYEKQLIKMCRKAAAQRFGLVKNPDTKEADHLLTNGTYTKAGMHFIKENEHLITTLINKLEAVQLADTMEHDRSFLYGQIAKWTESAEIIFHLQSQLNSMEAYWADVEADYEWRQKAIQWMKGLPSGSDGILLFLTGLTSEYIRAFILQIEVESPVRYRIRWFDNIWTEVRMLSDNCSDN